MIKFWQRPFVPKNESWESSGLANHGYAFIPNFCRLNKNCKLMMVLWGHKRIGKRMMHYLGELAYSNRMIVIAPR